MKKINNDFTINVATANGTGSQSANLMLLLPFRYGAPVMVKIYFRQIFLDYLLVYYSPI